MPNTMTPTHPRWQEFHDRLEGPEGCNFHEVNGKVQWDCIAEKERPHSRRILAAMGVDVEQSLAYFDQHGGYCDCEVLFNVAASVQRHETRRR